MKLLCQFPKCYFNLIWSNVEKIGWLNKNGKVVIVVVVMVVVVVLVVVVVVVAVVVVVVLVVVVNLDISFCSQCRLNMESS